MSFQAKRLRVQLPCGEGTVIDEGAQQAAGLCRIPSICHPYLSGACLCTHLTPCHFGTPVTCLPTVSNCGFVSPCRFGSCGFGSPCLNSIGCAAGSVDPGPDPGPIVVDAEHLPALRDALEAQLEEIGKAEKALEEHGKGEG